jgi:hypothetical protein
MPLESGMEDYQQCSVAESARGWAMHTLLLLLGFYLALQLPLGILVGDFCAQG